MSDSADSWINTIILVGLAGILSTTFFIARWLDELEEAVNANDYRFDSLQTKIDNIHRTLHEFRRQDQYERRPIN